MKLPDHEATSNCIREYMDHENACYIFNLIVCEIWTLRNLTVAAKFCVKLILSEWICSVRVG